jgi:hypothetical protein
MIGVTHCPRAVISAVEIDSFEVMDVAANKICSSTRHNRQFLVKREHAQRCILVVRNDSVVAAKPKSAVTFYVDGVARFPFFRGEDRFDCSNELIAG